MAPQEPFVDGVTESLTTDLSRIRGAVVIARNTAFTYKGKPFDVKTLWMRAPETASRLRGRIEAVLASAQVDGHIHSDRTNPARWRGWLDRKLPNPKKIGERGHYTALPYADLPEFMARLGREPGTVAKASPSSS